MAADALSQPLGCNKGKDNNWDIQMIPEDAFICITDKDSPRSLESRITDSQRDFKEVLEDPKAY
jgi:hypothetical protein